MQQKQILELTHFLNLTMNQVREHKNALYDIDNRLLLVNKTLMTNIKTSMLSAVEARIVLARLNNGIIGLQENVDKIYEYPKPWQAMR